MNYFPFKEIKLFRNTYLRIFNKDLSDEELIWHMDREDRYVKSIFKTDWSLQLDNELPININEKRFIPKETFHRLIKGQSNLYVIVKKLYIK